MRLLADLHISPRTVQHLNALGHDVIRVSDLLPPTTPDRKIVEEAVRQDRIILTHDLDFSAWIALSGRSGPSLISLRLSSAHTDHVNSILDRFLPVIEADVKAGALVTMEDDRVRIRRLPLS